MTLREQLQALTRLAWENNLPDAATWILEQCLEDEDDPQLENFSRTAARYLWLRESAVLLSEDQLSFGVGFNQTQPELLDEAIDRMMQHALRQSAKAMKWPGHDSPDSEKAQVEDITK